MRIINYKKLFILPLVIFGLSVNAGAQQQGIYQKQKIGRENRISFSNNYGDITIRGWDKDGIEAVATDMNTSKTVPVVIKENSAKEILITIEYEQKRPAKVKINLEIKLPHYAQIETIYNAANDVSIFDVDGIANIKTDSGNININRIGSLQAKTANGNISVKNVRGSVIIETGNGNVVIEDTEDNSNKTENEKNAAELIDIMTGNGNIRMRNVKSDVRIVAINGKIDLACVKGDVAIRDASSQINLSNIGGNVEVSTSNGQANFTGAIRSEGRYRLKTLSGSVSVSIPEEVGFTALLTSYKGRIETNFSVPDNPQKMSDKINKRINLRVGDGKAKIELDSFDGRIEFNKLTQNEVKNCGK